jgi:hypothetical protein
MLFIITTTTKSKAAVVYLIRPNRGLTAVLLGKSTTTTKSK